jgi:hypothetical protein
MPNDEAGQPAATGDTPAKSSLWWSVKRAVLRTDSELSYFKGLTFAGLLSTLLVAYFQNLSAYQDKVAAQAKNDIEAATQTFTDTSNALLTALALQQRLTIDFYSAVPDDVYKNDDAYLTRDARSTYSAYLNAYDALHQNYNLCARKAEIYLDWASDVTRDPARNTSPSTDPIFMSLLGEYDFDCENDMQSFFGNTTTKFTAKTILRIHNWSSTGTALSTTC